MPRRRADPPFLLLLLLLPLAVFPARAADAQEAALVLSLPQCIDAAFAAGTDIDILQKNLAVSREQYNVAVSQSAYALSASVGENAAYGSGDAILLATNSLSSGFTQYPAGRHHPRHADHERGTSPRPPTCPPAPWHR